MTEITTREYTYDTMGRIAKEVITVQTIPEKSELKQGTGYSAAPYTNTIPYSGTCGTSGYISSVPCGNGIATTTTNGARNTDAVIIHTP